MQIAVLAHEYSKIELLEKGFPGEMQIVWANNFQEMLETPADAYFDLLFELSGARISGLQQLVNKPVFIHSVTATLEEIGQPFIRINGWPGFMNRKVIEIAVIDIEQKEKAGSLLSILRWPFRIVPDEPGMIAARVIAMIVNEAYFTLGEGVSSKSAIDIAMKLGTNYPFGPFEWSKQIGLQHIYELLLRLNKNDDRYQVAGALIHELNQHT